MLRETLQQAYGPGFKPNEFIEHYVWFGQRVRALYTENAVTENSTVSLMDRILVEERARDEKAQAKKAASGL
jgi:hypothetical protein